MLPKFSSAKLYFFFVNYSLTRKHFKCHRLFFPTVYVFNCFFFCLFARQRSRQTYISMSYSCKKYYLKNRPVMSRDFKNCVYSYSDPEAVSRSSWREKSKSERSGYKLILPQGFPLYDRYLVFKKENICCKLFTCSIEHLSKNSQRIPISKYFPFPCKQEYCLWVTE